MRRIVIGILIGATVSTFAGDTDAPGAPIAEPVADTTPTPEPVAECPACPPCVNGVPGEVMDAARQFIQDHAPTIELDD